MTTAIGKSLTAVAAATLFAVTGCSGSDGSSDAASLSTPADVAQAAKCTGYHSGSTDELFVKEQGKCSIGGAEVTIDTFASTDDVTSFYDVASGFGGLYLVGDTWIVTGPRDALEAARDTIGSGTVK